MTTYTFKIANYARYMSIVDAAAKNGSLPSLLEQFAWLSMGSHSVDRRVELCAHDGRSEFSVAWYMNDDTYPWMTGGLIYHPATNTWSIHT